MELLPSIHNQWSGTATLNPEHVFKQVIHSKGAHRKAGNLHIISSIEKLNIFLIREKRKGLPGGAIWPEVLNGHLPVNNSETAVHSPKSLKKPINRITRVKITKNIIHNLIPNIMKKQILILVLAIFAGSTAFGQMKAGSAPQPLTGCTTDATHPMAGVPYNYAATVDPAGGNFQWWATKDFNFISTTAAGVTTNNSDKKLTVAAKDLLATSTNYGTTGTVNNVDITWSSAALAATTPAAPTFVVVQYDAVSPACANNLKVYQINPVNGFTVDIKNVDQAKATLAYGAAYSLCVSNIYSATYDAGTKAIVTDYGTNVLYFEVVAANFTGSYTPFIQVSGLQGGQTVKSLELFTDAAFASTAITTTLAAGAYSPAAPINVDPSVANTSTGVSIYVKLTLANGTYETLTDQKITVAVDGTNASGQKDVVNTACNTQTDYEDIAEQTITRRPKVTSVPATGVFVTP